MKNFIKKTLSFFSKENIVKATAAITKKSGESTCDYCHKNVSSFMGGVGTEENGYKNTVQCIPCCDKENEGIEFKWENQDEEKQIIEYNAYKNGEKIRGINVSYWTEEQISRHEKIQEQLNKKYIDENN